MDLRKLKTLIDLVSESNISELEITEAEGKVRIVKEGSRAGVTYAAPSPGAPAPVPAPVAAESLVPPPPAPAAAAGKVIKSPMVGTYYRAASPGAPPFQSGRDGWSVRPFTFSNVLPPSVLARRFAGLVPA